MAVHLKPEQQLGIDAEEFQHVPQYLGLLRAQQIGELMNRQRSHCSVRRLPAIWATSSATTRPASAISPIYSAIVALPNAWA